MSTSRYLSLEKTLKKQIENMTPAQQDALIAGLEEKLNKVNAAKSTHSKKIARTSPQTSAAMPAEKKSSTKEQRIDLLLNQLSDDNDSRELTLIKKILRSRTAEDHIKNSAAQMRNYLQQDYDEEKNTEGRIDLQKNAVRRLLTLMQGGYVYAGATHIEPLPSGVPSHNAASILSGGGRAIIELPPGDENQTRDVLHAILGFTIEEGLRNGALQSRPFASHGQRVVNGHMKEELYSTASLEGIANIAFNYAKGGHLAMNLGIGWDGAKNVDGCNGHLYMHYVPPTQDSPGGLMFGIETCAPGKTNPYGASHGASALPGEFTSCAVKNTDWPFKNQVKSGQFLSPNNGLKIELPSKTDLLKKEMQRIHDNYATVESRLESEIKVQPPINRQSGQNLFSHKIEAVTAQRPLQNRPSRQAPPPPGQLTDAQRKKYEEGYATIVRNTGSDILQQDSLPTSITTLKKNTAVADTISAKPKTTPPQAELFAPKHMVARAATTAINKQNPPLLPAKTSSQQARLFAKKVIKSPMLKIALAVTAPVPTMVGGAAYYLFNKQAKKRNAQEINEKNNAPVPKKKQP